jgi:hypothetical protein
VVVPICGVEVQVVLEEVLQSLDIAFQVVAAEVVEVEQV